MRSARPTKQFLFYIICITIIFTALIRYLTPDVELLPPTGKHIISTEVHHFEDLDRKSPFETGKQRRLKAKVWFPAKRGSLMKPLVKENYWGKNAYTYTSELMELMKLPGFLMSHLYKISTHTYRFLDISDDKEKYPVVILSHGYISGTEVSNTQLAEDIASHGYIVISINHTHESLISFYQKENLFKKPKKRTRNSK